MPQTTALRKWFKGWAQGIIESEGLDWNQIHALVCSYIGDIAPGRTTLWHFANADRLQPSARTSSAIQRLKNSIEGRSALKLTQAPVNLDQNLNIINLDKALQEKLPSQKSKHLHDISNNRKLTSACKRAASGEFSFGIKAKVCGVPAVCSVSPLEDGVLLIITTEG